MVAPALHEVALTKSQRKHVNEIQQKMLKMLQSPVSQAYSSSDSSSVIILGKLPSSQKKNSTVEHKSAAGESEKKSIMSIGSFGEEMNKILAEQERREKEKGEGGGGGGGGGESLSPSPNIDPDLFKAMKDARNLGIAGPSAPSTTHSKKNASKHKGSCVAHGGGGGQSKVLSAAAGGTGKGSKDREHHREHHRDRERDCEQKSESNNNSNKKSLGSTKNETSCSCPSDAEP